VPDLAAGPVSIGAGSAAILAREVFVRPFASRRQVAAYLGLTPSAYASGTMMRCQGISKGIAGRVGS
jgi:transposase